jgi:uncharacterized membrane protein YcaP (DUF421 family)
MDVVEIIFRSVIVYLFIIIAIRIFGKRELSQLSVIDLVFILLISNSVQNAMVGPNNTLTGGLIAALTLFLVNHLLQYSMQRSKKLSRVLNGETIMLIYKGKLLASHLKLAGITGDELEEAVREHGVASSREVDLAVLETDGNISIISDNYRHRTVHKHKGHQKVTSR